MIRSEAALTRVYSVCNDPSLDCYPPGTARRERDVRAIKLANGWHM